MHSLIPDKILFQSKKWRQMKSLLRFLTILMFHTNGSHITISYTWSEATFFYECDFILCITIWLIIMYCIMQIVRYSGKYNCSNLADSWVLTISKGGMNNRQDNTGHPCCKLNMHVFAQCNNTFFLCWIHKYRIMIKHTRYWFWPLFHFAFSNINHLYSVKRFFFSIAQF